MSAASPWLLRWAHLIPPGGRVLDLAAGSGRQRPDETEETAERAAGTRLLFVIVINANSISCNYDKQWVAESIKLTNGLRIT